MTKGQFSGGLQRSLLIQDIALLGLTPSEIKAIAAKDPTPPGVVKRQGEELAKARHLVETDPQKAYAMFPNPYLPKDNPAEPKS